MQLDQPEIIHLHLKKWSCKCAGPVLYAAAAVSVQRRGADTAAGAEDELRGGHLFLRLRRRRPQCRLGGALLVDGAQCPSVLG